MGTGLPFVGTTRKKRKRPKKWADTKAFSKGSLAYPTDAPPDGAGPEDDAEIRLNSRHVTDNDLFDAAKAARKRIEAGSPGRVGGKFKRLPGEVRQTRYISSIRLDFVSAEILKLHADQRRVHMSVLVSDILNAWLADATDYHQALFKAILPPGVRAAPVPERYVGYLASLGVRNLAMYEDLPEVEDEPGPVVVPPPPPPIASLPPEPEAFEPPVLVPPPVMEAPAVSIGWGSAAAAYTIGMTPGSGGPVETLLASETEERVAQLQAETAASRRELGIVDG